MGSKYHVGNLRIAPAAGWLDVTRQIDADSPPFSLARSDGVGVMQFSVAEYEHGELPNIQPNHLKRLLADFALSREIGRGFDLVSREKPLLTCAQSYIYGTQFLRVWYCSNGRDVVLVTYVCAQGAQPAELPDCEKMIESLEFVQ